MGSPIDELREESRSAAASGFVSDRLAALLKTRDCLKLASTKEVVFSPPLISQFGEGIIYPHTFTLIQGKKGAHKSRCAELLSSIVIAQARLNCDTLGFDFQGKPDEKYSLCYVDTERNLSEQLPYALQQIKLRAGYSREEHPANFDYISLKNTPRRERFEALNEYMSFVRSSFEGHIVIVLDQLADLVKDFNSVEESLLLSDLLNVMIDEQNVTIIGIIHENPGGGEKARGHLGTEAGNKATTILQVGYAPTSQGTSDELVMMRYIKRRMGSPNLTYFARYDEETRGLVTVDDDMVASSAAKVQRDLMGEKRQLILSLLGDTLREQVLNTKQLTEALSRQGVKNTRNIPVLLTQIANDGTVFSDSANREYRLKAKQDGLATALSLEPIEPALKVAS